MEPNAYVINYSIVPCPPKCLMFPKLWRNIFNCFNNREEERLILTLLPTPLSTAFLSVLAFFPTVNGLPSLRG